MPREELATAVLQAPWLDEDLLRQLYQDEQMSQTAIAEKWDCSQSTVGKWLDRHGIEKRSRSEAVSLGYGNGRYKVPFQTHTTGPECWRHTYKHEKDTVYVHRLVAVAKYGFEAVANMDVHHKNEIPWDNRPENLTVLTHGEHSSHHKKVSGLDRLRIAELYENGDIGSYLLARRLDLDVDPNTVRAIHKEFYGDAS